MVGIRPGSDLVYELCWKQPILTRTNFIREGLPKGGHSSTHTFAETRGRGDKGSLVSR